MRDDMQACLLCTTMPKRHNEHTHLPPTSCRPALPSCLDISPREHGIPQHPHCSGGFAVGWITSNFLGHDNLRWCRGSPSWRSSSSVASHTSQLLLLSLSECAWVCGHGVCVWSRLCAKPQQYLFDGAAAVCCCWCWAVVAVVVVLLLLLVVEVVAGWCLANNLYGGRVRRALPRRYYCRGWGQSTVVVCVYAGTKNPTVVDDLIECSEREICEQRRTCVANSPNRIPWTH